MFLDHKNEIEKINTSSKVNATEMRKKILQHDDYLKKMKNEFEAIKLQMSSTSPDTQAKLKDLHLRARQLETIQTDKLQRQNLIQKRNFWKQKLESHRAPSQNKSHSASWQHQDDKSEL